MAVETHIESLKQKHRALESQLHELTNAPSASTIELAEVKRRKLQIKDEISRLARS